MEAGEKSVFLGQTGSKHRKPFYLPLRSLEFSFPDGMHVAVKRLGCSIIQSAGGAVNLKPSNREKRPSTQQHSGSVGLLILPVINRFH